MFISEAVRNTTRISLEWQVLLPSGHWLGKEVRSLKVTDRANLSWALLCHWAGTKGHLR